MSSLANRPSKVVTRGNGCLRLLSGIQLATLRRALAVVVIALACGHAGASAAQTPLRLAFNHNWPPYSAQDDQDRPSGIFFDIVDEAFNRRMGIPLKAIGLPWARAQAYVLDGEVDGLITVPTGERLEYLVASDSVFTIFLNVYVDRASPNHAALAEVRDVAGLAPFEACEIYGNQSAIARYRRLHIDNVRFVSTYQQCFQMLSRQRTDFVVVPPALAARQIVELGLAASIVELPLKIPANHHLLLRKDSPYADALPEFNRVIRTMREEGIIEAIAARHGVKGLLP
jgi:polar amino acid transport system substrate-binding protein